MPAIDKSKSIELDKKTKDVFFHKGYQVSTLLGKGSFGEVYKGVLIQTGQLCAVKMMNLTKMSERFKRRFLPRELTSLMELKHPNIVRVFDIFKSNRKIYVMMEFASNGDIAGYLKKHGSLSETRAHTWFYQMSIAINYLHEQMYTAHRVRNNNNIKIDNVLLSENWIAKVTGKKVVIVGASVSHFSKLYLDFGFCVEAVSTEGEVILSKTFCGTMPYYSPQLAMKVSTGYDPFKADVWAAGVVLYAMTHNRFPFHFRDLKLMLKEQGDVNFKNTRIDHNLPRDLKNLLLSMFEFEEVTRISFSKILQDNWILRLKDTQPESIVEE